MFHAGTLRLWLGWSNKLAKSTLIYPPLAFISLAIGVHIGLLRKVSKEKSNLAITGSLLLTVFLWGGNNAGTKWLVNDWPPIFAGATRSLAAGLLLLALLRFTNWLGVFHPITSAQYRQLWWRGGLSLAAYVAVFFWAVHLTNASHVALYLGASPIWALLWEERPRWTWNSAQRYGAALLAVSGVVLLLWPALQAGTGNINFIGELCGLASSLFWANYSRQCRHLARRVDGVEIAAHSMWMSGVCLLPLGLLPLWHHPLLVDKPHVEVQLLCILFGGVIPYALWNGALRHWQTSKVMLFNNFIPVSTTIWAYFALHEPITPTFCTAMVLIALGVLLGQADWSKIFGTPESF